MGNARTPITSDLAIKKADSIDRMDEARKTGWHPLSTQERLRLGRRIYYATKGMKRHRAVDTLGLPFFTHCTTAHVSDEAGLLER